MLGLALKQMNVQHCGANNQRKPFFLITIDTEGDNLWSTPRSITTQNALFLPRFQSLCESYGMKPTYLTNYEMAVSPFFQEFGRDVLNREAGEIGMHLHAWNTPPLVPLTEDDFTFQPYLVEYPKNVMRDKITVMTDMLEDIFGVKMISHRAGRWSFNETYAQILVEKEYRVDCSVTPHVSRVNYLGDPKQGGGTDYSRFPDEAYFLDLADISRPGNSPLLEIPVSIVCPQRPLIDWLRMFIKNSWLERRVLNRFFPPIQWLRPNGRNRRGLLYIMQRAINERKSSVEFMLHSSELMPGASPTFPDDKDIEALYDDLEVIFDLAQDQFTGATLTEYYQKFLNSNHQEYARIGHDGKVTQVSRELDPV